jgi:hypothetical protein
MAQSISTVAIKSEEAKERARQYNREYNRREKEKISARKKKYWQENKESLRGKNREKSIRYYYANKHKWVMTREKKDRANELERKRRADSEEERIKHREEVKVWHLANPGKRKASRLKPYGVTLEQYENILEAQGYKCAICGYSDRSNPKIFPFLDHCHTLNQVRGILCCYCNFALGNMRDSPALLRKAAKYLERNAFIGPLEVNGRKNDVYENDAGDSEGSGAVARHKEQP